MHTNHQPDKSDRSIYSIAYIWAMHDKRYKNKRQNPRYVRLLCKKKTKITIDK